MNKRVLALISVFAMSALTAGCVNFDVGRAAARSDRPKVTVVDGQIVVDPPALLFSRGQGTTRIQWSLPRDSAWTFPKDGIVIEGEVTALLSGGTIEVKDPSRRDTPTSTVIDRNQKEIVECKASPDFKEFSCLNRNTRPGVYKYTVRVTDGKTTLQRDPPIMNGN